MPHLQEPPRGHPDCLTGKTFVVSGVLDSLKREEAQDFVKRHGGKVGWGTVKGSMGVMCGGWWIGVGFVWGLKLCAQRYGRGSRAAQVPYILGCVGAQHQGVQASHPPLLCRAVLQVTSNVSSKTSFLVAGNFLGRSKYTNAKQHKVGWRD